MITKAEIRDALKVHHDAINSMKQALLANDGDKVSTFLEAANAAWVVVEELLARKYPEFIELGEGDESEEEETDDEEEADEGEEEDDDSEEEEDDE
jgi:hypothetical protein